jgi:hypothetical protein
MSLLEHAVTLRTLPYWSSVYVTFLQPIFFEIRFNIIPLNVTIQGLAVILRIWQKPCEILQLRTRHSDKKFFR